MNNPSAPKVTVEATVQAPIEKVWTYWTEPVHIMKWSYATEEWHVPKAENDLREGGAFLNRMEAKDGSMGFDFDGVYDTVKPHQEITYTLGDGRKVEILFEDQGGVTKVVQTFEAEATHAVEMQQQGWQAIMNHFKQYTEQA
ncbi:SRPBCC family protein [Paenibacillus sp. F411]|uniref:Activator of Hsp90 ATPase 1 family protein n=1 Tax=Paenibacillus algicola TaxID=2565926 RepID=A0A4P8XPQ4_9BACL|nr:MULTISPECIES: SRPBCC family protein [Paenibacillus]MBO2944538.1 SRPBCC family protein [Paenibacillus sp. F411]QCT04832.1 Activator of Hsp90 ATPase 1 family protein [Paenibacillus algicola]